MDVILDTTINDLENYRKNDIGEVKVIYLLILL